MHSMGLLTIDRTISRVLQSLIPVEELTKMNGSLRGPI